MQQRAKILSHQSQQLLRSKKKRDAARSIIEKEEKEGKQCQAHHKNYNEAKEKLSTVSRDSPLSANTLEHFFKLNKQMLKAFIHVRLFTSGTTPKGQAKMIPDKKGKIEDALRGEENLLLVAHRSRNLPVILPHKENEFLLFGVYLYWGAAIREPDFP